MEALMGAYCVLAQLPHHSARVDETLEVLWSDYYGAALFGDEGEIACIPHSGCRLEIVATAETAHRGVDLLLPGQVLGYRHSLFLPDRLTLPSGAKVWLGHFVGFKLQLAPNITSPPPREEDLIRLLWRRRSGLGLREQVHAAHVSQRLATRRAV
jgi:hypothetical protein